MDRHGKGPSSLSALRTVLSETRQRGHATEDGEVTPGLQSVAAAVLDHNAHPVAGVAVTFPSDAGDVDAIATAVTRDGRPADPAGQREGSRRALTMIRVR